MRVWNYSTLSEVRILMNPLLILWLYWREGYAGALIDSDLVKMPTKITSQEDAKVKTKLEASRKQLHNH